MTIETKEKVTRLIVTSSKKICDKCDKEIKVYSYDVFESTLEIKEGFQYPDGGDGTLKKLDLCQDCSEELITTLKELGYKIQELEWDN